MRATARTRAVNIVDETFIDAPPRILAAVVADPDNHDAWWPHLDLTLARDRGLQGQRWRVSGRFVGEMEVWIEPFWDGAIVHHYVRGTLGARAPRDAVERHTRRWKHVVTRLKDGLEGDPL